MGTRSMIYFTDTDRGEVISAVYSQYDGDPEFSAGRGCDLYNFLAGRRIVNGFSLGDSWLDTSNGMEDLAAQALIALKYSRLGGVYQMSPPARLDDIPASAEAVGAEYAYVVSESGGSPRIAVYAVGKKTPLFEGTAEEMGARFGYPDNQRMSLDAKRDRYEKFVMESLADAGFPKLSALAEQYAAAEKPRSPFTEWIPDMPALEQWEQGAKWEASQSSPDQTRLDCKRNWAVRNIAAADLNGAVARFELEREKNESFPAWSERSCVFGRSWPMPEAREEEGPSPA